ncbi:hypothetical protein WR25_01150 [Diploscapter pachys]|uniref:Uncharacterized protein n=1 Tax=Diploscapter pachys TaxID=2018661 RepID=A0A2A2KBB6_9BILA|nr:hypothetical protein WR25_01150 [Diploscapter pachys]
MARSDGADENRPGTMASAASKELSMRSDSKKWAFEALPQHIKASEASSRKARLRSINSFEEITEVDDEGPATFEQNSNNSSSEHRPTTAQLFANRAFAHTRSHSLHALLSPNLSKRPMGQPQHRLHRGLSDNSTMHRKTSLPTNFTRHSLDSSRHSLTDLLALPPIPEATSPISPSSLQFDPVIESQSSQ